MSSQSSMLHVRMDTDLKQKATETLAAMGMTVSDAVRLLFTASRSIRHSLSNSRFRTREREERWPRSTSW